MSKLRSSVPVKAAAERHAAGESLRSLAAAYGVTVQTLSRHLTRAGYAVRSRHDAVVRENEQRRGVGSRGGRAQPRKDDPSRPSAYEYVQALRKRKAEIVARWKSDRGCQRCPERHPATLDLHHRDPADKHERLRHRNRKKDDGGKRTGGYFWRDLSYADLAAELAKCDVLCSNCHRKLEWEARQPSSE